MELILIADVFASRIPTPLGRKCDGESWIKLFSPFKFNSLSWPFSLRPSLPSGGLCRDDAMGWVSGALLSLPIFSVASAPGSWSAVVLARQTCSSKCSVPQAKQEASTPSLVVCLHLGPSHPSKWFRLIALGTGSTKLLCDLSSPGASSQLISRSPAGMGNGNTSSKSHGSWQRPFANSVLLFYSVQHLDTGSLLDIIFPNALSDKTSFLPFQALSQPQHFCRSETTSVSDLFVSPFPGSEGLLVSFFCSLTTFFSKYHSLSSALGYLCSLIFYFKIFYWCIVDLQSCVSSRWTAKWMIVPLHISTPF